MEIAGDTSKELQTVRKRVAHLVVSIFTFLFFFPPLIFAVEECDPLVPGKMLSLPESLYLTLKYQQEIEISKLNVKFQQGVVQQLKGPFDVQVNSLFSYTETENPQDLASGIKGKGLTANETILHVGINKKTRLGTLFNLTIDADRIHNPINVIAGLAPSTRTDTAAIAFRVVQPLLRDFINGVDAINERASYLELEAVYWDMLGTISQKIFSSIQSYWDWVAANKQLLIRIDAEKRFINLIEMTKVLINNDEAARTAVDEPEAQLAVERRNRIRAEQNVYTALTDLKFGMGVTENVGQEVDPLYMEDDFSTIDNELSALKKYAIRFEQYSEDHRYDILAAEAREIEAAILLKGALNGELPQLNVFGSMKRSDFKLGEHATSLLSAMDMRTPQVDMTIGVEFSMPLQNNNAIGIVRQRRALLSKSVATKTLLIQSSLKNIREALRNQIALSYELKEANLAVDKYQNLVTNEKKKLQAGYSTVFVVVDYENKLTDALSNRIIVHTQYMQNIALIRLLTGTIFNVSGCFDEIDLQNPKTLPFDMIL